MLERLKERKVKHRLDASMVMIVGIICLGLCFSLPGGCTKPKDATRVLEQQGYSDIQITGWRPFMADKNDVFSTGFKAKSPNGSEVTGAVTRGIFKGSTIRLD